MHVLTLVILLCLLSSFVYTQKPVTNGSARKETTTSRPPWAPVPSNRKSCSKRRFVRGRACGGGFIPSCPRLSCIERALFKTQAEIRLLANQAGAVLRSSRSTLSAGGRASRGKRSNAIGCGNYVYYETMLTSITDCITGETFSLAHIPSGCNGCNGPLYQMVFFNDCTNEYCCNGEGTCSPIAVDMNYIDSGWNVITVKQVLFCDCLNQITSWSTINKG